MIKTRKNLPRHTENKLLYESAHTCCVCRTPALPIQIHHIDQNPSNNVENNLVVLCQNCHDEAHTEHKMSKNLTANKLKYYKNEWNEEIRTRASIAMLPRIHSHCAMWTYVNHQRLPDLIRMFNVPFDSDLFDELKNENAIDKYGNPRFLKRGINKEYITIYDHFDWDISQMLHKLYTKAIDDLIVKSVPTEIGAIWSKNQINDLIVAGSIIFCMRGFYFKQMPIIDSEEDRHVHTRSNKIRIEFIANTRHMYGMSALRTNFSGHKFVAALLLVKNMKYESGDLVIECTPLALGYGFSKSSYSTPYPLKYGWAITEKICADIEPDFEEFETFESIFG